MRKMKQLSFSKACIASIVFFLFSAVLFYLCSKLFFYDEDIFILNRNSNFISDLTRASVVKLTFLADTFFYNKHPAGYHVTSVLLHLFNTLIATYTFKTFLEVAKFPDLKRNAPYFFFFLFLLSPIHSEPLCYILGRAGLVVTFFCTLSFLFFLKANFEHKRALSISLVLFLVALFSYEISWTLPLIILATGAFLKYRQSLQSKRVVFYVTPYFVLFFLWFIIKIVITDKIRITPYGNSMFLSFKTAALIKNGIVLFFRNIIPSFQSTPVFIVLCAIAAMLIVSVLLILKRKNRPLLFLGLLIIFAWLLAFLPALVFGINSHNSESERYIYFSSVFASMFLAVAFCLIESKWVMNPVVIITCFTYSFFLFARIDDYVKGGKFSRIYIRLLANEYRNSETVYLINQPSQLNGALLFRAYGDRRDSSGNRLCTINDYMHTLNSGSPASYITLSKRKINKNDVISNVVVMASDSISSLFPEFFVDRAARLLINTATGDSVHFKKGNIIIGLKIPSAYVFE